MRSIFVLAVCAVAWAGPVWAELQNVDVGGRVTMRSRMWTNSLVRVRETRIPTFFLPGRAIGPFGTNSRYRWSDRGTNLDFIEMDTRLNVNADFTDEVRAFIELESFDVWGTDFRSDYVSGADRAGVTTDDVEFLYSYIEASDMFGIPLQLRIGRQPLAFGRGWLVSEKNNGLRGLAFDGLRLTYSGTDYALDGWISILEEEGFGAEDGDITFGGLHGTYTGFAGHELSAYWLWVRDPRSLNDTNFIAPLEWVEDIFGLDDYDPTNLHTLGVRAVGDFGAMDYALEAAYQFGDFDQLGFGFKPFIYGDDDVDFSEYGLDLELGYTFEVAWTPRVYAGGAYFSGEDNRDLSFLEWLNPFDLPEASTGFNRLFSATGYNSIFDNRKDTSNFWQVRAGVDLAPSEKVSANVEVAKYGTVESFDVPLSFEAGPFRVPIAPALPFLTQEADDDMGWGTILDVKYRYSDDLTFRFLYEYLFTGEAFEDGTFNSANGIDFNGGRGRDDAQYLELRAELKF